MTLRQLAERNADVTGQTRLGGQQIVATRIEAMLADVVADGEQLAGAIVQEREIHLRQLVALAGQTLQLGNLSSGVCPGLFHQFPELDEPGLRFQDLRACFARPLNRVI
jgi:hypothetical protein